MSGPLAGKAEVVVPPRPSPAFGSQAQPRRVSSWGAVGSVSAGIIQRLWPPPTQGCFFLSAAEPGAGEGEVAAGEGPAGAECGGEQGAHGKTGGLLGRGPELVPGCGRAPAGDPGPVPGAGAQVQQGQAPHQGLPAEVRGWGLGFLGLGGTERPVVAFPPHSSPVGRQGAQKLEGPVVGMPGFVMTGRQRLWEELGPPDLRTRSRQKRPRWSRGRGRGP